MKIKGFTVVEVLVVIVILGILLTISTVAYGAWQKDLADSVVKSDLASGDSSLHSFRNFNNNFPPNLAGTNFAASKNVALVLYTNAPSMGVYNDLDENENAQLLLNVCNANLDNTNNTACVFNGQGNGAKIHVKGTQASNTHWRSPIYETDIILPGADPSIAAGIISQFKAQGGTFPVIVRGHSTVLPEPDKVPNGPATRFCLEARSAGFDIIYHVTDKESKPKDGNCPEDPELHYYP